MAESAIYEDKPKGSDEVKRWFDEIALAEKAEKNWRADAKASIDLYRNEGKKDRQKDGTTKETFNILWSNVEIKSQALYSAEPRPDIRRRHKQRDPIGKAVSELLERCITYTIDCQDVDSVLVNNVNDMLLPGRGLARIRYHSQFSKDDQGKDTDEIEYEEASLEHVQWDDFLRGPAKTWSNELPWIGFKHRLTKDEITEKFGEEAAQKVSYDVEARTESKESDGDQEKTVFCRALVYEIWDKQEREVLWLADGFADEFLDRQDDPLELQDFWPIPKPLYAIESSTSLVPICEYSMYSMLARELEKVSRRRNKIADALRVRGVADSTLTELKKVFESEDNEIIPAENLSRLVEAGGLDKFVWMLPIDILVKAYQVLGQQRHDLIQQIYEVTGISDIIRGDTNPNETLGAQQIKANFGSLRLERQKQAVQKYARRLIELIAEVIAENFSRETLSLMSGMQFPTKAEHEQAQQMIQMGQQRLQSLQSVGQPQNMMAMGMTPQMVQAEQQRIQKQMQQAQQILSKPNWESLEEVLKNDFLREYRVDIETDSTISIDVQKEQENLTEYMSGMGNFSRYAGEAMGTGLLTLPAAQKMMIAFARKFHLGREVEDELEQSSNQPQKPDPEAQAAQMEQKIKQMEMQHEQKMQQMEEQAKMREEKMEILQQRMELEQKQKEALLEARQMQREDTYKQREHERKMEELEAQDGAGEQ